LFAALQARAESAPRQRMNENLHPSPEDPVQRMAVALRPGTYVRPHRHAEAGRWELLLCLQGRLDVLCFADDGAVVERLPLAADGVTRGVELAAGTWHSLVAGPQGAILFEVKQGPYQPLQAADFAAWAPAEGVPEAVALVRWMERAGVGARYPGAAA